MQQSGQVYIEDKCTKVVIMAIYQCSTQNNKMTLQQQHNLTLLHTN